MRIFLTTLFIIILSSGCATRNAFSKLDIEKEQEEAIEHTRSGKITYEDKIAGIYSVVFLNNVYEEMDEETNQFYISMYLKNKNTDLNITLNQVKPRHFIRLEEENEYSHLLGMKTDWTDNYIVVFENNNTTSPILKIDSDQFSSGLLNFREEQ